jgi:hypothetical protein
MKLINKLKSPQSVKWKLNVYDNYTTIHLQKKHNTTIITNELIVDPYPFYKRINTLL